MLILSRKVHQEIVLGNGIRITVVAIRGKQVRVGIDAPPHFHIRRDELAPLPHLAPTKNEDGRADDQADLDGGMVAVASKGATRVETR